jgi:GNAT superfamily N-acetyltransferase
VFASATLARRIDLVEAALVRAIVVRVQRRQPGAGAFASPVAGGWALFAGVGNPVNKVIGIGFDAPPDGQEFAAVERAYESAGSETRAEVATLARAETHAWLSRRGFQLEGFENVLGHTLRGGAAELDAPPPLASPAHVRVAVDSELDEWVRVVTDGFAAPDDSGAGGDQALPQGDDLAVMIDDALRADGNLRYLARVEGEIAGGASMRIDDGVALLAGAATLPAFRRRGVQRALLRSRLADAARAGCELAVVVTQPGSISQANAQRQGFALLYSRSVLVKG